MSNTDNSKMSIVVSEDDQIYINLPEVDTDTFIRWMGVAIYQISHNQGFSILDLMYAITHTAIEISNLERSEEQGEDEVPDEEYIEGEVL